MRLKLEPVLKITWWGFLFIQLIQRVRQECSAWNGNADVQIWTKEILDIMGDRQRSDHEWQRRRPDRFCQNRDGGCVSTLTSILRIHLSVIIDYYQREECRSLWYKKQSNVDIQWFYKAHIAKWGNLSLPMGIRDWVNYLQGDFRIMPWSQPRFAGYWQTAVPSKGRASRPR